MIVDRKNIGVRLRNQWCCFRKRSRQQQSKCSRVKSQKCSIVKLSKIKYGNWNLMFFKTTMPTSTSIIQLRSQLATVSSLSSSTVKPYSRPILQSWSNWFATIPTETINQLFVTDDSDHFVSFWVNYFYIMCLFVLEGRLCYVPASYNPNFDYLNLERWPTSFPRKWLTAKLWYLQK